MSDQEVVTEETKHCTKKSRKFPAGLLHLLSKYSDNCSLNGVVFIKSSKSLAVKLTWAFLLLVALCLMSYHLYRLSATYLEYKKQTKIDLTFSNLQFPALTICNANPVRMSMKYLATPELNTLIEATDPVRILGLVDDWGQSVFSSPVGTPRNRSAQGRYFPAKGNFFDSFDLRINVTLPWEIQEDYDYEESSTDIQLQARSIDSSSTQQSSVYRSEQLFKALLSLEERDVRKRMGHGMQDMLIQCAFAGRPCTHKDFILTQSSTYGNCYTLQYPEFVSRRSGPADGLELILYLETDEYIRGISTGKGAHVVIHEQETVPFPTEEGIAIVAGTQSIIGIRQVEISRLDEPYGRCTDVKVFKEKYGVKYTRMVCQKTCEQNLIRQSCGCYDELQEEVNVILKNSLNLPPCRTRKDKKCTNAVELTFGEASSTCGCDSPCSEKKYAKTITLRQWPNPSFATLIREIICKDRPGQKCDRLRNKTNTELSQEFVKLNVFYEDLNYEHLSEEADYELSQYISDIGGTIGLWVGLSLLGIVEVFKLMIDVIIYLVGRLRKANSRHCYIFR